VVSSGGIFGGQNRRFVRDEAIDEAELEAVQISLPQRLLVGADDKLACFGKRGSST
jgi:hypothetical protein